VVVSIRELLLLESDVSETPPGVVVGLIGLDCFTVAFHAVIEVLVCNELVTTQGVGI